MIQDLESSKEMVSKYKQTKNQGKPNGIEVNVQILNSNWEVEKSKFQKITLPKSLILAEEDFTNYYIGLKKMHKIEFILGLVCYYN